MSSQSVTAYKRECNEASEDSFQNAKEQVPFKEKQQQQKKKIRSKAENDHSQKNADKDAIHDTQKSTTIQQNREEVKQTSNTQAKKTIVALGETIRRGCAEACERSNKEKESGKGRGRQVIAVAPRKEDKGKHIATVCGRNMGGGVNLRSNHMQQNRT
jgi:hypothetical protein